MFRSSLQAVILAFVGLVFVSSVNAGLMAEASNSTQALLSHGPSPDNPFEGITINIDPTTFSNSIIERTEPAAELDRRIVGALVRGAAKIIEKVFSIVTEGIAKDKSARGEFTKRIVAEGIRSKPEYNWIICHTKHRTQFKGTKGTDWGHQHKEFDVKIGGTVGYEIYYAREGEFWRDGDGGYLNWAYQGFFKADNGGKHIVFSRPPGK